MFSILDGSNYYADLRTSVGIAIQYAIVPVGFSKYAPLPPKATALVITSRDRGTLLWWIERLEEEEGRAAA